MNRSTRTYVAFGLLLAINSASGAAITVVDVVDHRSGQPGTYFLPPATSPDAAPYYRWWDQDWSWSHSLSPLPASIISAKLQIEAYDVDEFSLPDAEWDIVYVDGVKLGQLDNNFHNTWHTSTFNFGSTARAQLMDGAATVMIDIDSLHNKNTFAVTLRKAALTVSYEPGASPGPGSGPGPGPGPGYPIPAPSALALAFLGSGFVGWLSRRRTL
jgi:hypothetical protein